MAMAAAIESRTAEAPTWSAARRIAQVEILHDLRQAETIWRVLEDRQQFSTPYQRFDLLGSWQRQVAERDNIRPFIVIAYDAERRPLLLLPLALTLRHGIRTACFMGGKHITFNMALWDRDFAAAATADDLNALISGIRARSAADVLALTQQPLRWRQLPNPMALLPNHASVNDCPLLTIEPDAAPAGLMTKLATVFSGWQDDPARADSGPAEADKGFVQGSRVATVEVSWEPGPGASCSDKQPLSTCNITPQQKLWSVAIDIVEK